MKPSREIIEIGKKCQNCGGEIRIRRCEVTWALKNKKFCNQKCSNRWRVENTDQMERTAAMRLAARSDEVKSKRLEALIRSPKRFNITIAAHSEDAIKKANISRSKIPGFQSVPENFSAKWWRLRDDRGRLHEFKNLSWFIRTHPELFSFEDINWDKLTKSKAYGGIRSLRPNPSRKKVNGTWKGWTWYSQTERLKNEGHDLLDRERV